MDDLKKQIHHIKGFISPSEISIIYEYAKENDNEFTEIGNNEAEFTVHTFQAGSADREVVRDLVTDIGKKVYNYVCKTYSGPFLPFDPWMSHIARFSEGYGMHEHFDESKPNDIATLVYINSDYLGGEIYFPDYDIFIKPEAGDLVCFPDNPNYVHGVKPILSGIRYTTPRWFTRIV